MTAETRFAFGSFRFDVRSGQLWRDEGSEVKLTPRAACVLHVLAERAQELVTKRELLDRVWGGMAVGDDALTSCVHELRNALGDDARCPRYIETRHRRGYRLMMPAAPYFDQRGSGLLQVSVPEPSRLAGRAVELAELARGFDQARLGRRQVVFATGEPGIGKSSLVDVFLEQLRTEHVVKIAYGQCLDHHGAGEPYLPLIEAFTRLARGQDGPAVKRVLSAEAPSWLAQMASLWTKPERRTFQARGRATRERMMRELTLAVETIASDVPLVLKLEDIHWSDASTLDWLAHMARRLEPAHLLVLATFRPAGAAATQAGLHSLVTELALHGWCREIVLNPLGLEAIESYLKARLGEEAGAGQFREIAPLLLERTGGNPLFMTSIVNELEQQEASRRRLLAVASVPYSVRRFIDRQIDELDEQDCSLLAAASAIRREFAAAAVAATLGIDVGEVETNCARLARQGVFISRAGSAIWPDGTRSECFSFRHDLYRELLYDRLPATRRALYHARAGQRLDAGWTGALDAVASELAEHFDRGNEFARAIPHHQRAAAKALRRSANQEAINHLRRALNAIGHILNEIERTRVEVELLIALGAAFMATRGFGAPEVLEAYSRAEALCERLGERADIFPALWGQWLFQWGRSDVDRAWQLCARLLTLAEKSGDAGLKLQAHHAAWATSFGRGELADVHAHAEAGLTLYDETAHQAMASNYGNHDAGICARYFSALSLAFAGDKERAYSMADRAIAAAKNLNDPFSLALSLYFASVAAQVLGDVARAARDADASGRIAAEHDLAMPRAWSAGVTGWCLAETRDPDRGITILTEAIAALQGTHSRHFMPYLLGLLADANMKAGHQGDAMKAVERGIALADPSGERFYSAELHRLHGELLVRPPCSLRPKAEASFRNAIKIARQQGAAVLEERATASLHRWFE